MDPLTHIAFTHRLVGKQFRVLLAGIGPDAPFYLAYPAWVMVRGKVRHALAANEWPDPPRWMLTLHNTFHSLPLTVAGAAVVRALRGRWPRQELAAWTLHIVVDIPTHSRDPWGPRFLWPLSSVAVDGVPWTDLLFRFWRRVAK